jgi:hypothetical protein
VLCLQETELRASISYIFDRMRFNLEFLDYIFSFLEQGPSMHTESWVDLVKLTIS